MARLPCSVPAKVALEERNNRVLSFEPSGENNLAGKAPACAEGASRSPSLYPGWAFNLLCLWGGGTGTAFGVLGTHDGPLEPEEGVFDCLEGYASLRKAPHLALPCRLQSEALEEAEGGAPGKNEAKEFMGLVEKITKEHMRGLVDKLAMAIEAKKEKSTWKGGGGEKRRMVRELVRRGKVDILCLQVTKSEGCVDELIREFRGGRLVNGVPSPTKGRAGGLVILWNAYEVEEVENMKDNPPCNTLFIGNLGENIIEEELRHIFSAQPGYKQMKILRQERNTVCFIEFEDVNTATAVHQALQGAVIPSSGRGGMRIQYPCADE
ncbi:hypothetical protein Taro_029191 [Colocasia esculenta]|uniref:RRM domain-containing protein n=1 Tax=Colocasia esculenta TaxID=4460 RepID=A0A843VQE8_COLES|nr:hypothetical protein [Colocasia esculenta]